jgi:hypothetical protein
MENLGEYPQLEETFKDGEDILGDKKLVEKEERNLGCFKDT